MVVPEALAELVDRSALAGDDLRADWIGLASEHHLVDALPLLLARLDQLPVGPAPWDIQLSTWLSAIVALSPADDPALGGRALRAVLARADPRRTYLSDPAALAAFPRRCCAATRILAAPSPTISGDLRFALAVGRGEQVGEIRDAWSEALRHLFALAVGRGEQVGEIRDAWSEALRHLEAFLGHQHEAFLVLLTRDDTRRLWAAGAEWIGKLGTPAWVDHVAPLARRLRAGEGDAAGDLRALVAALMWGVGVDRVEEVLSAGGAPRRCLTLADAATDDWILSVVALLGPTAPTYNSRTGSPAAPAGVPTRRPLATAQSCC